MKCQSHWEVLDELISISFTLTIVETRPDLHEDKTLSMPVHSYDPLRFVRKFRVIVSQNLHSPYRVCLIWMCIPPTVFSQYSRGSKHILISRISSVICSRDGLNFKRYLVCTWSLNHPGVLCLKDAISLLSSYSRIHVKCTKNIKDTLPKLWCM